MRETLRDIMMTVAALAALFAAYQSWTNAGEIGAVRKDLTREIGAVRMDLTREIAVVQGTLQTTSETVIAHVNASGLHGPVMLAERE